MVYLHVCARTYKETPIFYDIGTARGKNSRTNLNDNENVGTNDKI